MKKLFFLLFIPTLVDAVTIDNPLKYDTFQDIVNAIIGFLWILVPTVATVMFVIAGFLFVTSAGDPNRVATAKKMMLYTAIGLAIVLLASGLIKVLQSVLGVKEAVFLLLNYFT